MTLCLRSPLPPRSIRLPPSCNPIYILARRLVSWKWSADDFTTKGLHTAVKWKMEWGKRMTKMIVFYSLLIHSIWSSSHQEWLNFSKQFLLLFHSQIMASLWCLVASFGFAVCGKCFFVFWSRSIIGNLCKLSHKTSNAFEMVRQTLIHSVAH